MKITEEQPEGYDDKTLNLEPVASGPAKDIAVWIEVDGKEQATVHMNFDDLVRMLRTYAYAHDIPLNAPVYRGRS